MTKENPDLTIKIDYDTYVNGVNFVLIGGVFAPNYVLVKDENDSTKAYLVIHGVASGKVITAKGIKPESPRKWLRRNFDMLSKEGITEILTLSCFGGNQHAYEYNGVHISSFHDSILPAYVEFCIKPGTTLFDEDSYYLKFWKFSPEMPKWARWISEKIAAFKRWKTGGVVKYRNGYKD